jgi:hypothetical protein
MDTTDLHDFHEGGMPVEKIADFLCRDVDKVQAKIDEVEASDRRRSAPIGTRHKSQLHASSHRLPTVVRLSSDAAR